MLMSLLCVYRYICLCMLLSLLCLLILLYVDVTFGSLLVPMNVGVTFLCLLIVFIGIPVC